MSVALLEQVPPQDERLVTLPDITWEQFKAIEAQLQNNRGIRLTYLSGVMEIMSPGGRHERVKSTLGLLLEAYIREKGIRFYVSGGFTLEQKGYASGTPDESYCIGTDKEIPDIVIEIIITSGTIDRKELYKPLRVPEVWFWKSNQLRIFHLQGEDYQEVSRSEFFPELDKALLLGYVAHHDQYDAVNEFVKAIRS